MSEEIDVPWALDTVALLNQFGHASAKNLADYTTALAEALEHVLRELERIRVLLEESDIECLGVADDGSENCTEFPIRDAVIEGIDKHCQAARELLPTKSEADTPRA